MPWKAAWPLPAIPFITWRRDVAVRTSGIFEAVGRRNAVDVPLAVIGCDFRTAPSSYREVLVTTPEQRHELTEAIRRMDPACGFMALETCNRNEWVVSTEEPQWIGELLEAQMLNRWAEAFPGTPDLPQVNVYVGKDAALHVFRLVAGLESLSSGEAEIAGQFQQALQNAMSEKTTSRILNGIGRFAGGMAKTSFRMGFRSTRTRGIHVLVGQFLQQHFRGTSAGRRALVVGMGEIGRKIADFLEANVDVQVTRMNRTVAGKHEQAWVPLSELMAHAAAADAVVLATGARTPVVTREMLAPLVRETPMLVMDVGIPRQAHPDVESLPSILYRNVDHLAALNVEGPAGQESALEEEVVRQVDRFKRFCLERHMVRLLRRAQEKRLEMTQETIGRLVEEKLGDLLPPQERAKVAQAMRDLVREYSNDVFDSLHSSLEEFWSNQ